MSGRGVVEEDASTKSKVAAGDTILTGDGASHAVEAIGEAPPGHARRYRPVLSLHGRGTKVSHGTLLAARNRNPSSDTLTRTHLLDPLNRPT
ncbi:MAG: hypothetical protein K9N51_11855 [Candidatus Pacebacteria bacterium]|nr:hypothetical protein [Candidatus Paceibacterota bacterium]